jgi:uncharacterized membrane protein (UPF0127 family)
VAQLIDTDSGRLLVPRLVLARSFFARLRGLLGRDRIDPDEGLWIEPCDSVHMIGMRFSIDAIYLDAGGSVLAVDAGLRPWRVSGPVRGARTVVELPAGAAERLGIAVGSRVRWMADGIAGD